jgi:predicted kinase
MVAEENGCFDQPYAFANDHARFLFYRELLSSLHYTPRHEFRCTVTLLSGVPGSGKDTWLARHRPTLPVVSLDELRTDLDVDATDNQGEVIQAARETCREHLGAGRDFAFNGTNTTRQTRKRWIDLFANYGARVEVVYVEPPLSVIFQQNERRTKPVPKRVIQHLVDKLEPPTWAEAHSLFLVG